MTSASLPELVELERICEEGKRHLDVRTVRAAELDGRRLPIYAVSMGNSAPDTPAVGFFGGIHGLERIGTQVVLAFMQSLLARLQWDRVLQHQLDSVRLVFMPLVNPGGMWRRTRSNPRGVDLMRNAPVEAAGKVPYLLGGQRLSARLPWYRGPANVPMEVENEAVCQVVRDELLCRKFSVVLDCHSGFGMQDRIWFPFARSTEPLRHLEEIRALQRLFDRTYPNHDYVFEPQSRQYLTHGDLWDYLYLQALALGERTFLPLTLEMGSWRWVRKRPRQLFSRLGIFNPQLPHRLQRVLRRHLVWLDFLTRAACAHGMWARETTREAGQGQAAIAA
jgi:hypothetical protein